MRRNHGITLITLVVTIVVLLILAAVSISMLTGENGIITQAQNSKEETEQAKCEELVTVAINGLITENSGDKSKITPQDIAEEGTFPTNILFPEEGRKVGVSIEIGTTDWDSLPTKEARIIGMNPKYCNSIDGGYTSDTGEKYKDTNYDIILDDGTKLTDTLVVPYQVEINGELYKITEANVMAYGEKKIEASASGKWRGYTYPNVQTIIFPNTIKKISNENYIGYPNYTIQHIKLPNKLEIIGENAFSGCEGLNNITIPNSVTTIVNSAFWGCDGLTTINYTGTQEQWNTISGNENVPSRATINYNYKGE